MHVPNVGWKTSSLVLGGQTGCKGQIGVVILRWEGRFTVHFVGVKTSVPRSLNCCGMSEVVLGRTVNQGDPTVLALGRGQLEPLRISGHHDKAMTNNSGYIAPSFNPSFGQRTPRIPRDTQVPGSRVPDPATNMNLPDLD